MAASQFMTHDGLVDSLALTARWHFPVTNRQMPVNPSRISHMWQDLGMSQTFGMETPSEHSPIAHRRPVRYLVVIDAGGSKVARLFLDTHDMVGEFDAAVAEVTVMTNGLVPQVGAFGPEWDAALQGHNATERAAALVYTLAI